MKRKKPQVDEHRYYVHLIAPQTIWKTVINRGATSSFTYACRRAREVAKANPFPMMSRVVDQFEMPWVKRLYCYKDGEMIAFSAGAQESEQP